MPPEELRRSRLLLAAVLAVLAAYLAARFGVAWYLNPGSRMPGDFEVYWRAAERLVSQESIYVPADASPYKYSLAFAEAFRFTFFLLEARLAAAVWMTLSVLGFFGVLYVYVRRLLPLARSPLYAVGALFASIALSWSGILETLNYGQVDLLLVAGAMGAVATSSVAARAAIWAAILAVKPHWGMVFLAVSIGGGAREFLKLSAAAALVYLAPIAWLGPSGWAGSLAEWVTCLRVQQDAAFMTSHLNLSLAAVLSRITGWTEGVGTLSAIGIGLDLVGLGWLLALRLRQGESLRFKLVALAFGLTGYLLFSPLSWRWFVFLWCPIVVTYASLGPRELGLTAWAALAFLARFRFFGALSAEDVHFAGVRAGATVALFVVLAEQVRGVDRQAKA